MMNRPKLLDLFCGAGGAAMGYHRAGFDVVGVDINPMPRYLLEFHQGDALQYALEHGAEFDAIHASPPCQGYSVTKSIHGRTDHPLLIDATRELLQSIGRPYIIENVEGAPLINPLMLCGTMFGLRVRRHRLFEIDPPIYFAPFSCNHWGKTLGNSARIKQRRVVQSFALADFITVSGHDFNARDARIAMGIDWMSAKELAQAIPPAYTEYIGAFLLRYLK
jgi:DNA (cytosine-5)-methyltransferase 1